MLDIARGLQVERQVYILYSNYLSNKYSFSDSGEVEYESIAPDTITSWVTSAFAINDKSGLGIAPTTSKVRILSGNDLINCLFQLRVFRPFFIRLNLPYSVKRGEKFALQALIFNYLDNEEDVSIDLDGRDSYCSIELILYILR